MSPKLDIIAITITEQRIIRFCWYVVGRCRCPYYSQERLAGDAASSNNASLIADFSGSTFFLLITGPLRIHSALFVYNFVKLYSRFLDALSDFSRALQGLHGVVQSAGQSIWSIAIRWCIDRASWVADGRIWLLLLQKLHQYRLASL